MDEALRAGSLMPRIEIHSATGFHWPIATRQAETVLHAWFDEILPWAYVDPRPVDDFERIWPHIVVWPMWAWKAGAPSDPDWLTDNRVLGRRIIFPAADGDSGLRELVNIKQALQAELRFLDASGS